MIERMEITKEDCEKCTHSNKLDGFTICKSPIDCHQHRSNFRFKLSLDKTCDLCEYEDGDMSHYPPPLHHPCTTCTVIPTEFKSKLPPSIIAQKMGAAAAGGIIESGIFMLNKAGDNKKDDI